MKMSNIFGIPYEPIGTLKIFPNRMMRTAIYEKRLWKERLFTLPWKPFKKYKIVGYKPMDEFLMIDKDTIICAPEIADKIINDIKLQNQLLKIN